MVRRASFGCPRNILAKLLDEMDISISRTGYLWMMITIRHRSSGSLV